MLEIIVAVFFFVGLLDYTIGNKMGLGEHFYKGLSILPTLLLSMVGIYSISPVLGHFIGIGFGPLSRLTGIDLSLFPNIFIAMDLGGYNIAKTLAANAVIRDFSGVLVGSLLGATLSFVLPVGLGIIKKEQAPFFMKGFIIGMIALPFGVFAGGLVQGVPLDSLFLLSLPLLLVSVVIIVLFFINDKIIISFFKGFQMVLTIIGSIGLLFLGIQSITGRQFIAGMMPLEACFLLIGRVALFLGGVYPLVELIRRILLKRLAPVSEKVGLEEATLIGILANMVNNIIIFDDFHNMADKDKLFISVLAVTMPYMLGGQLAYVVAEAPHMVPAYIIAKIVAGLIGLGILWMITTVEKKKANPQTLVE